MFKKAAENLANGANNPKPSGMDLAMQSIIRALGVPPDMLADYLNQGKVIAEQFVILIAEIEIKLATINTEQAAHRKLLEEIHASVTHGPVAPVTLQLTEATEPRA